LRRSRCWWPLLLLLLLLMVLLLLLVLVVLLAAWCTRTQSNSWVHAGKPPRLTALKQQ